MNDTIVEIQIVLVLMLYNLVFDIFAITSASDFAFAIKSIFIHRTEMEFIAHINNTYYIHE